MEIKLPGRPGPVNQWILRQFAGLAYCCPMAASHSARKRSRLARSRVASKDGPMVIGR